MLEVSKCLNEARKWIEENGSKSWFVNVILDEGEDYLVCIDSFDINAMDIPILVINKWSEEIEPHQIIEKGFFEKINKAKVVFGELELEEDEENGETKK